MESNSGEGLEKRQRYELPLFDHEELPDDQTTTYDISPTEQMETHQDKEASGFLKVFLCSFLKSIHKKDSVRNHWNTYRIFESSSTTV